MDHPDAIWMSGDSLRHNNLGGTAAAATLDTCLFLLKLSHGISNRTSTEGSSGSEGTLATSQ